MDKDDYWRGFLPWGVLILATQLVLIGGTIWVAVHFIRKYW